MRAATTTMLHGGRVSLRAVEPADLDLLFLLENDPEGCRTSLGSAPASRQMLWRYIEEYKADIYAERQLRLVIAANDDGRAIGTVDISDFDPRDRRGFVGIAIIAGERRRGYGREALDLLCRYAEHTLGMHQLAAIVAADNEASRALFDAAGFATCGRLRSWLRTARHYTDAVLFQKLFSL